MTHNQIFAKCQRFLICRSTGYPTHNQASKEENTNENIQAEGDYGVHNHLKMRSKLKSSLCKNFAQNGSCPYGNRCQFAHGPQELRCNLNANTSYKTKYCNAFLKKQYCCYGYRCNFIHSEPEPTTEQFAQKQFTKMKQIYQNHRQIIAQGRKRTESRLLNLLGQQQL